MKALLAGILILALVAPGVGQRIETQRADRTVVRRVETTANHLTVIELNEPVVMAAAGSPSFKIERQGNKVLIQPIEDDATTNLFIWTASGRFSYELVPATSIATTDFAIDQQSYAPEKKEPPAGKKESEFHHESVPQDIPIRSIGDALASNSGITITGVYQEGERFFVRYEASNSVRPDVFELKSPQSSDSLQNLRYTQVDSKIAGTIRDSGTRRIVVMDCKTPETSESGEHVPGLLTLAFNSFNPKDSGPAVLRLVFKTAKSKSTSVVLVL